PQPIRVCDQPSSLVVATVLTTACSSRDRTWLATRARRAKYGGQVTVLQPSSPETQTSPGRAAVAGRCPCATPVSSNHRSTTSCTWCGVTPRMADTEVSSTRTRYAGNRGSDSHHANTGPSVPRRPSLLVVVALEVLGADHRAQPRPAEEDRTHHDEDEARPQVGVDAAGLVLLRVAED